MRFTTPIPNSLFDVHLKNLKPTEVVVMLIIFRQTLGWVDPKTGRRKIKDWISHTQFVKKTGLSNRTITHAINVLYEKKLILITDEYGNYLNSSSRRRGKGKIYYAPFFKKSASCDLLKGKNCG